jgi:REP element-mobilizing transposase RayT
MDIEIKEIAVDPDHVHIFFKYPPSYSWQNAKTKIERHIYRVDASNN